jgi:hypothetical protein
MDEKTIDQTEEVLICEISDEAVEAAGTRTEIAGVRTSFAPAAFIAIGCIHAAMKSPGLGRPGL